MADNLPFFLQDYIRKQPSNVTRRLLSEKFQSIFELASQSKFDSRRFLIFFSDEENLNDPDFFIALLKFTLLWPSAVNMNKQNMYELNMWSDIFGQDNYKDILNECNQDQYTTIYLNLVRLFLTKRFGYKIIKNSFYSLLNGLKFNVQQENLF